MAGLEEHKETLRLKIIEDIHHHITCRHYEEADRLTALLKMGFVEVATESDSTKYDL